MQGGAIWSPHAPIKLFGLHDETLAFQVIVSAGDRPLHGVEIDIRGAAPCMEVRRFVVHDLPMKRRSGGNTPRRSLGWTAAAMPPAVAAGGALPDVLIPSELAPRWADYPMTVKPGRHRVVWFDITIAEHAAAGRCDATVVVHNQVAHGNRQLSVPLASMALQLEVGAPTLPYRSVKTMVYYSPQELLSRFDDGRIVALHEQLLHRHQLSSIMPLRSAADVERHGAALDGTLFTSVHGYRGAGVGVASDIVVIGAYGSMGPPSAAALRQLREVLAALAQRGIASATQDILLYTVDEQCDSPLSAAWRHALDQAGGQLAQLKVGHSCSTTPAEQPVDVVLVMADAYHPDSANAAIEAGKQVWIYNGVLPYTGSFLSDSWPLSLRANAWIQARYKIERWFYWESTFWNDDNRGGLGPYDPLAGAETFHNSDGDHCNGDGVLVYPATQSSGFRSLNSLAVLPSIRLKQWRRGISDIGYLALAKQRNPRAADAILARIVPRALSAAKGMSAPPFSVRPQDYQRARRQLFELIAHPAR